MVLVQTGSETVSGNMGMPRLETKRSGIFGKIPDRDRDRWVWSGLNWVPIGLGPNFPNTTNTPDSFIGSMLFVPQMCLPVLYKYWPLPTCMFSSLVIISLLLVTSVHSQTLFSLNKNFCTDYTSFIVS